MSKLIALDNGHGIRTPGKRSPILPNGQKSEIGLPYLNEYLFNRAVVRYLAAELERCGFRTLLVSPTENDTPLSQRVNLANSKKADLYISIHANAAHDEVYWGNWGGIETYIWSSGESKRIGTIIHKHVMTNSPLRDRGVKDGSGLYVIRKTIMPAVLCELGFMDSLHDYKYLLQESYRKDCAVKIAKGVCEAYGAKYVSSGDQPDKPTSTSSSGMYRLMADGKHIGSWGNQEYLLEAIRKEIKKQPAKIMIEKV